MLIIYPDMNIITWQFLENKNKALERIKELKYIGNKCTLLYWPNDG